MSIKSVAIDVGHCLDTYEKTGGKGCILNNQIIEEHDLNLLIAKTLYEQLRMLGITVNYSLPLGTLEPDILNTRTNNINKLNPDVSISIHHDYGSSKGFTIYTWKDNTESLKLKNQISEKFKKIGMKECPLNYNGYSVCYPGHRNFALVREPNCNSMLIEIGFFNNSDDVEFTKKNYNLIAKSIIEGLLNTTIETTTIEANTYNSNNVVEEVINLTNVKTIQQKIKNLGINIAVDGILGKVTSFYILGIQNAGNLKLDGVWGNNTENYYQSFLKNATPETAHFKKHEFNNKYPSKSLLIQLESTRYYLGNDPIYI